MRTKSSVWCIFPFRYIIEKIKKEIEELEKEWEQNPPHSELK